MGEQRPDPFASTAAEDALVGQVFGEYRLCRPIGRGGMGAVYAAEHVRLGRTAAVKLLLPELARDRKVLQRFIAEAKAVAALQHPSIVDVHDVIEGDRPAIIMELLRGEVLSSVIATGPLQVERVSWIAWQILSCLQVVHQRGIIHRDLKPANVFLVDDGVHRDTVKILDFGIAKFTDGAAFGVTGTQSGALLGTPLYMSPEQIEGRSVEPQTDLYALGCIVHEMLVGEPPFRASTLTALISAHLLERPVPPSKRRPGVPGFLDAFVVRCLEKRTGDRFASARQGLQALEKANVEQDAATAASAAAPGRPPASGRRLWLLAGGLAVLGGAGAVAWVAGRGGGGVAPPSQAVHWGDDDAGALPRGTAPGAFEERIEGRVEERLDGGGYSYLRLSTDRGDVWVAGLMTTVERGTMVALANPLLMRDFVSSALGRRFPRLYLGRLAPVVESVADIRADRSHLSGTRVTVRGRVLKVSSAGPGKNWLHLRDDAGDEDLVVRSGNTWPLGKVVLATGTVRVDVDYGSGYRYDVLIDDATLAPDGRI